MDVKTSIYISPVMKKFFIHNILLFLCLYVLLPAQGSARNRKPQEVLSVEDILPSSARYLSPAAWHQGMPFVLLRNNIGVSLLPEEPSDTISQRSEKGDIWYYDSMVSEEDWMGQELLQLRFLSPQGKAYRFSTGRPLSVISDTNYQPVLGSLYPLQLIQEVDSLLRTRTFYILLNDERVSYYADTLAGYKHEKFVPVVIDSVSCGNELAPLSVSFHLDNREKYGCFSASLPGSRETGTSTSLDRFLSLSDPYLMHPDITLEVWNLIKQGSVRLDMTSEEVRLSWGRPLKVEKGAARNGMIELWYYSNNRILQFWDGRLYKTGIM